MCQVLLTKSKSVWRLCTPSACKFPVIFHKNAREYIQYSLRFLFHRTKNLTTHLSHNLCAVLPQCINERRCRQKSSQWQNVKDCIKFTVWCSWPESSRRSVAQDTIVLSRWACRNIKGNTSQKIKRYKYKICTFFGAADRTWTGTVSLPRDFLTTLCYHSHTKLYVVVRTWSLPYPFRLR